MDKFEISADALEAYGKHIEDKENNPPERIYKKSQQIIAVADDGHWLAPDYNHGHPK